MARTMAWRTEGRLHVVVHSRSSPTNLEWARLMNELRPHAVGDLRIVVFSKGGGPDGAQRRALSEELGTRNVPTAVLTRSLLARGIVGAVGLFNPGIRAFDPDDLAAACTFLGLSADERERVSSLLRELELQIHEASQTSPHLP